MKAFTMQSKNKIGAWAHMRPPLCDYVFAPMRSTCVYFHFIETNKIQVHRKFFIDSDFSYNYLHTPYMFARLSQEQFLFDV